MTRERLLVKNFVSWNFRKVLSCPCDITLARYFACVTACVRAIARVKRRRLLNQVMLRTDSATLEGEKGEERRRKEKATNKSLLVSNQYRF